ncbi:MAG: hypothetical protein ACOYOK_07060 [Pseudobdellovibrionaceae bacterium]
MNYPRRHMKIHLIKIFSFLLCFSIFTLLYSSSAYAGFVPLQPGGSTQDQNSAPPANGPSSGIPSVPINSGDNSPALPPPSLEDGDNNSSVPVVVLPPISQPGSASNMLPPENNLQPVNPYVNFCNIAILPEGNYELERAIKPMLGFLGYKLVSVYDEKRFFITLSIKFSVGVLRGKSRLFFYDGRTDYRDLQPHPLLIGGIDLESANASPQGINQLLENLISSLQPCRDFPPSYRPPWNAPLLDINPNNFNNPPVP